MNRNAGRRMAHRRGINRPERRIISRRDDAGGGLLLLGFTLHVWLIGSIGAAITEGVGRIVPWPAVAAYWAAIVVGARRVAVVA